MNRLAFTEGGSLHSNTTKHRILVVEDDALVSDALGSCLEGEGYLVSTAKNGREALKALSADSVPNIILLDLKMPVMDGWEFRRIQKLDPKLSAIPVVAISAVGVAKTNPISAHAYLRKPVAAREVLTTVARILSDYEGQVATRLVEPARPATIAPANVVLFPIARATANTGQKDNAQASCDGTLDVPGFEEIIGRSERMREVLKTVTQIAPSRASVLITGESGTGKELIAAAIHQRSPRASGPFVKLHCAALVDSLLESELFGHERGSFTGALNRHDGRFFKANHGTLFLDEIGEVSPSVQVKLLRFLQDREFEPVGSNQTITVDVRVIAATNRDIHALVAQGKFREDLFYRLNVINVEMPSLRTRPVDVRLLAVHFLRKYSAENCKRIAGFSTEALEQLAAYRWPGNVRELENVVERAVVLAQSEEVTSADLPAEIVAGGACDDIQIPGATLDEIENYAIKKTFESTGRSTRRTAEILNISVRKIQYRLLEYERGTNVLPSRPALPATVNSSLGVAVPVQALVEPS